MDGQKGGAPLVLVVKHAKMLGVVGDFAEQEPICLAFRMANTIGE